MKQEKGSQQVLVWHNGKLCWRIRQTYVEYTRKPWYKGGGITGFEITYGEPRYIEVPEDNG